MPAIDILRHIDPAQIQARETAAASRVAPTQGETADTTFEDLLDIVNPLHHLPVVGTLYRAISGDTIDTLPRIAGNTLYGGLWGAVSAVANTVFAAVTGRDFGSTVLALVTEGLGLDGKANDEAPVRVADNARAPAPASEDGFVTAQQGEMAFHIALAEKGLDATLAAQAMHAYRRSHSLIPAGQR